MIGLTPRFMQRLADHLRHPPNTHSDTDTASFTRMCLGSIPLRLDTSDGVDTAFDQVMVKANAPPEAVDDGYTVDEDKTRVFPAVIARSTHSS